MNRKYITVTIMMVISVSMMITMLTAMLLAKHYSTMQFQLLGWFCRLVTETGVSDSDALMEALRENKTVMVSAEDDNILERYGYQAADFTGKSGKSAYLIAAVCFGIGVSVFLAAFWYWHRMECRHIRVVTEYLEKINADGQGLLFATEENEYSRLQDEIYKTVTILYQTRDAALRAKSNFADNLYHIAHQLKTPITAISLSAQMIEQKYESEYAGQIQRQVANLTHLEEALLLLARIDAGTLKLEMTKSDVFTVLTLAEENLQELSVLSNITIAVPETGEAEFTVDPEWTMQAIMNLITNCMEHSPPGSVVHCSYEQNPLYIRIQIWDEGKGFEKEDIPHLFERFYRGKSAAKGGIGIGLSLAKAIIEMQNGMITAGNIPEGGAFFEIRMYRH